MPKKDIRNWRIFKFFFLKTFYEIFYEKNLLYIIYILYIYIFIFIYKIISLISR